MTQRTATPLTRAQATSPGGWKSTDETRPSPVRDAMLRHTMQQASRRSCRIGQRQRGAGLMYDERASVTHPDFNEAAWIERLAAALEQVAAAEPSYYPLPTESGGYGSIDEFRSVLHSGYLDLAARAKQDPTAFIQFKESHLQVNEDPVEALAILRENPLIEPALEGSGIDESVGLRILGMTRGSNLKGLVARLAKLSVKEGGEEAARRLHRYLAAGENGTVPAHEITVIHGLVVKTRFNLGAGAYLAPYADAREEFGLPDEPEPLSKTSFPDAAVLVRGLEYGPSVARRPAILTAYPMCRSPTASLLTAVSTLSTGLSTASCSSTCSQSPHGSRCFPARFTSAWPNGSRRWTPTSPSALKFQRVLSPMCGPQATTSLGTMQTPFWIWPAAGTRMRTDQAR